jgi:hypothetical protein
MQTIKDLTIEQFKAVIGEVIEEKLLELLTDPDSGLTLRPEIEERLRQELQDPPPTSASVPAAEIARRRGLEW